MENKALDIIPKVIGIFTSLLIFLGIISSVVYYRSFAINILDNITIGESLLLFISKFSPLSICAVFGVLISKIFFNTPIEEDFKENNEVLLKNLSLSFWQKLHIIFVLIPLFLLSIMGFSPFSFWVLPLSLLIRMYVFLYIIKRLRIVFQYWKIENKIVDYIQIAGISVILIASIAMTEAYLVYTGYENKKATLYYLKGECLQTSSNTLYLGKSQLYYYLYDKANKKSIVIKADQIERLEIK